MSFMSNYFPIEGIQTRNYLYLLTAVLETKESSRLKFCISFPFFGVKVIWSWCNTRIRNDKNFGLVRKCPE